MRSLFTLLLAASTSMPAVRSCSPARAKAPLTPVASAKHDTKLEGTWYTRHEGHDVYLHVVPHEDSQVDLVLVFADEKGAHVLIYQGQATPGKGVGYLSLREKRFPDPTTDPYELAPDWMFARYRFGKGGELTLSWLSNEVTLDGKPEAVTGASEKAWVELEMSFNKLNRGR
jgi:hypothetical protein